jgi:hypothetical protein
LFRRSESERAVTGIVFLYSNLREKELFVSRLKWQTLKILLSVSAHVPALFIFAAFKCLFTQLSGFSILQQMPAYQAEIKRMWVVL